MCLDMPFFKVFSPKLSFHVHELFFDVSPSLITIVISPSRHPSSSSNVHVESPMSLNKFVDLNDFPNTKLDLHLLYQCPPPQKFKKSYDRICKFQLEWATKLPWVEGVLATYDILHNVQYRVCSNINKHSLLFGHKWDILMKHEGKSKAKKDLPQLGVKAR